MKLHDLVCLARQSTFRKHTFMQPAKVLTTLLVGAGLLAGTAYTAIAQPSPTPNSSPASTTTDQTQPAQNRATPTTRQAQLSEQDRQFVIRAAQGNVAEITLSQLATQRAVSPAVRAYATRMVADHTQASSALTQLALSKGLTPPRSMDAQHQALRARIGQIPGPRFDQVYMDAMVRDHANTVALFEQQAARGQDPDLKAFATQKLPALRDHLQAARRLAPNAAANR